MAACASSISLLSRVFGVVGLAGAGHKKPRRVGLGWLLVGGLLGSGCVTGPDPILTTGGKVPPTIENSLRCPRGTGIVFGRISGVQTAAWCERPAQSGGPGEKNGPFVDWYDTLQKKSTGLYENGLRQGAWRFYLPGGQLESEVLYEHGNVVPTAPSAVLTPTAPAPSAPAPAASSAPSPSAPPTAPMPSAPAVAPAAAPAAAAPVAAPVARPPTATAPAAAPR